MRNGERDKSREVFGGDANMVSRICHDGYGFRLLYRGKIHPPIRQGESLSWGLSFDD